MKSTVRSISSGRPSSSKPVFHSSPSRLPDLYNVAHTHPDLVHPDLLYCAQTEEIEAREIPQRAGNRESDLINGANSVLASVSAVLIAMNIGISSAFWSGFTFYAIAVCAYVWARKTASILGADGPKQWL